MIAPHVELLTGANQIGDTAICCTSCGESADVYEDVLPAAFGSGLPYTWSCTCNGLQILVKSNHQS